VDDAVKIVEGLAPRYEEHHGVSYSKPSLRAAVELSSRHLTDRYLPDKAIDVMDEVGAAGRLRPGAKQRRSVGVRDVEQLIARMTGTPLARASSSERVRLEGLDADIRKVVFGQVAVEAFDEGLVWNLPFLFITCPQKRLHSSGYGSPQNLISQAGFADSRVSCD
jgi:ATP-dependent Clp protease ATP-binding subunit ClpA